MCVNMNVLYVQSIVQCTYCIYSAPHIYIIYAHCAIRLFIYPRSTVRPPYNRQFYATALLRKIKRHGNVHC